MADKQLVSQYDGTMVKVGDTLRRVDRGAVVPDGADVEHVRILLDRGMVVEGVPAAGFTDPADTQGTFTTTAVSEPDDVDGDGPIPAKSASKGDWVAYAVAQGEPEADAEASTKDDLIAKYGSA